MKPVEDMTREEIEAERAAIRAAREKTLADESAQLNAKAEALRIVHDPNETADEPEGPSDPDSVSPAPWPHEFGRILDHIIEVRRPSPAALVAISMTGSPGMDSGTQMRIFSTFMVKHISPKSLDLVLGLMADPDSGVEMQDVISALTGEAASPA